MRFFLFVLFGYALAAVIKSTKQIIYLSLFYGLGLALVLLIGGYSTASHMSGDIRLSGGYLNPNAFGLSGMLVFLLALVCLSKRDIGLFLKVCLVIMASIGLIGVLKSSSRGAIVALFSGLVVTVIYTPQFVQKFRMFFLLFFAFSIIWFVNEGSVTDVLINRLSTERIESDRGSGRLDIWKDYLVKLPEYALTGVGMGRAMEATRNSWTYRWNAPHNIYLHILVEFGIVGLVLFMLFVKGLWSKILCCFSSDRSGLSPQSILGLLTAWLVANCFGDFFTARDTWIIFAVIVIYVNMKETS
jgi:O-antigen ligase